MTKAWTKPPTSTATESELGSEVEVGVAERATAGSLLLLLLTPPPTPSRRGVASLDPTSSSFSTILTE